MSEEKTVLENEELLIEVKKSGAELTRIYDKKKKREVLWEGDPSIWGRHAPILFPFVGKCFENKYVHQGKTYAIGQHGFARDMDFDLESVQDQEVWHTLTDSEETLAKYPFHFRLETGHRLEGRRLRVMWKVTNTGSEDLYFMIGAHPAFRVPEGKSVYDYTFDFHQKGALHYQAPDGDGYEEKALSGELPVGEGRVPLTKGFFQNVLTYIFDRGQIEKISLLLSGEPFVTIDCKGFPYTAVWTVEETHPFVCLEPWYGRCAEKGFQGELKDREGIVMLKAGEVFQSEYTIEVF